VPASGADERWRASRAPANVVDMSGDLAKLCALAVVVLLPPQDDGPRVEVDRETGRDGVEVRDGKYRCIAADGVVLAEGRYRDGAPQGKWTFRFPNGEERARGYFQSGLPTRDWRLWRADGELLAEAELEAGEPREVWTYFDADGEPDPVHSGTYRAYESRWPNGAVRDRGRLLDGRPHGDWIGLWSDGGPRERGVFVRGKRVGPWTFVHADGTVAQVPFGTDAPAPEWYGRPEPTEYERAAADEPAPAEARELPRLAGDPEPELAALISELATSDAGRRQQALKRLLAIGPRAVPFLIDALAARDLADAAEARRAAGLAEGLAAACRGRSFGWSPEPASAAQNAARVRRWHSLWSLTSGDGVLWGVICAAPATKEEAALDLDELTRWIGGAGPGGAARPARAEDAPDELVAALDRALDWLAAHQDESGRFSPDAFGKHCEARGETACVGEGSGGHEVGVTGLALLAFLRAGERVDSGEHADAIARAAGWLLSQQVAGGVFGRRKAYEHFYSHCIATMALSELLASLDSPDRAPGIRRAIERAVGAIEQARNTGDVPGWRYEFQPENEADTSVTGWAIHALCGARRVGVAVEEASFEAGLALIDAFTGDDGRVGYDSKGSLSARVADLIEAYPYDLAGEPMTAVGTTVRAAVAEATGVPADADALAKHAELLKRPPTWDPRGGRDVYYWLWGAQAAHALGGGARKAWGEALKTELAYHQEVRGEAEGSWSATGVWGHAGGRVYTTAAIAIALAAAVRPLD